MPADALHAADMARKAESIGIQKVHLGFLDTFALAVMAGAFIACGAILTTVTWAGSADSALSGPGRILGGLVFSLGLILVVVSGGELFTGNGLISIARASGKVSFTELLRNWIIVYIGNFVGAFGTALLTFIGRQYMFFGNSGSVGVAALNIGLGKVNLGFIQAIALGILCNALVCIAIWMSYSARSTIDKIAAVVLPVTAFVAAGFEHSVANMYFIPSALLIKYFGSADFWQAANLAQADYTGLTWGSFLWRNLLPVTIGNVIGGVVLVGLIFWVVYLRKKGHAQQRP